MEKRDVQISKGTWSTLLDLKYGIANRGWGPRLRSKFGYYTPDDWYEAYLCELVTPDTIWLDVGCGRRLFPSNPRAAEVLSSRCRRLVGIDPGNNIHGNRFVHEQVQGSIETYQTPVKFDLITLRMVAEHITNPEAMVGALAQLAKLGGRIVVYTVYRWSPASLVAAVTPMSFHHFAKRFLWNSEQRDTFPTAYKMNTHHALNDLFSRAGFKEESFQHLDDCRSFQQWRISSFIELAAWKSLRMIGVRYPEQCIIATYVRCAD